MHAVVGINYKNMKWKSLLTVFEFCIWKQMSLNGEKKFYCWLLRWPKIICDNATEISCACRAKSCLPSAAKVSKLFKKGSRINWKYFYSPSITCEARLNTIGVLDLWNFLQLVFWIMNACTLHSGSFLSLTLLHIYKTLRWLLLIYEVRSLVLLMKYQCLEPHCFQRFPDLYLLKFIPYQQNILVTGYRKFKTSMFLIIHFRLK